MGFGSYDESEQERQQSSEGPDEATVDAHENEHEGEMTFDSGASTDDLVSRLQEMKDDPDEDGDGDDA